MSSQTLRASLEHVVQLDAEGVNITETGDLLDLR